MKEEIDINNKKEIFEKFDFDYCYNSEKCSGELCRFFNDLCISEIADFDNIGAFIDLGRIAITLNQQYQRIKELEEENGYVVFVDGYDCNNNEIHRQEFIKYKDKCSELIEKTKRLKQLQKHLVKAVLDEVYNELICRFAYFVDNQDSAKIDIDAEEFVNILVKIEKKYKGE